MSFFHPRLIVFDLDGTLIDSAGDLHAALNQLLRELLRPALSLSEVKGMVGDGAAKLVRRALTARPGGTAIEPGAALERFLALYEADPIAHTRPYPDVERVLPALSARGYRLAVCTNKPERPTRVILEALGLAHHFDRIVGGDSLPWRKPDPRMLLDLVGRLRERPAETLLVGDSEVDQATAASARVPFVLMTGGYRRGRVGDIPCRAALDSFRELDWYLA